MIHKYVINGDIPDRGPDTAQILEYLMTDTRVEINWGNHDLMWMGAAAGSHELVAELIRVQLRYDNYDILEREYGIPLLPLTQFAESTYTSRPVKGFAPSVFSGNGHYSADLVAKMQKAVAVILWKLEAERSACLGVTPYLALLRTNASGTLCVTIGDVTHELLDQDFPTLDLAHPSRLTRQENAVLDTLVSSFKKSTRLQKHMSMLAERGSLYHIQDGILSFHATVPVNPDGSLRSIPVLGELFSGKALFDRLNQLYKSAFATKRPRQEILDLFYLGWKGPHSWTFGKSGMETFTRALVADKTTHTEEKSPYYVLLANPETAETLADHHGRFRTRWLSLENRKNLQWPYPGQNRKNERAVRAGGRVICGDGDSPKPMAISVSYW